MFTRKLYFAALSSSLIFTLLTVNAQVQSTQRIATPQRNPRLVVKPEMTRIERPVLTVDNQPDVDLRPEIASLGISIRPNQGGRGTCSVFAMTFLLEFMYAKNYGSKNADFSEEYLNY